MKYKLLAVSKSPKLSGVNIGDYIQALAASQYYPHIDGFIDRDEELKDYVGEECKVIMNGWYMHNPENWPPSDKIHPLFVAFHLNSGAKNEMLTERSISYLKKHQPIGCRDLNTVLLLREHDIDAYFSGCMTLTLGKEYHSDEKEDKTYIVDPIYNGALDIKNVFKAIIEIFLHPCDISKLYQTKQLYLHFGRNVIKKALKTALYYREYKKVFGRDLVMRSTYIHQESREYKESLSTDAERLAEATRLVQLYAKARLVITSRIHCALPCLGIETPVVFLEPKNDIEESSCRMGGLRDLLNIVSVDNGRLKTSYNALNNRMLPPPICNKASWKSLASALDAKCVKFMSG